MLGTPYFDKVTLHLENGNTMTVTADGNSPSNRYINSMTLNGSPYTKNYLTHDALMQGGNIVYTMSAEPNRSRGTSEADFPYSFTNEINKLK